MHNHSKTRRPWNEDSTWIGRYALTVSRLKQLPDARYEEVEIALKSVFASRLYYAVAFDVDGTLTKPDSAAVTPEMGRIVGRLLRRGVTVILITGRGPGSTKTAVEEIREHARLSEWYLRRLHCIVFNGAELFRSSGEPGALLDERELLSGWDVDTAWAWETVEAALVEAELRDNVFRVDEYENALRLVLTRADNVSAIAANAKSVLDDHDAETFVASGTYAGISSVSLGPTTKELALRRYSALEGIPKDAILRIGDQGAVGGNDYELLNDLHGFSVGTFSDEPGHCHPVLDEALESDLSGAEATERLLEMTLILPPLTLEPTEQVITRNFPKLRRVDRASRKGAAPEWERTRERVASALAYLIDYEFLRRFELADIVDPLSGAFRLRDWELDELDVKGPLAQIFELSLLLDLPGEPRTRRSMFSDSAVLLRGPDYWLGWTRPSMTGRQFLDVVGEFVLEATEALRSAEALEPGLARYKLTLAIADHVRNFLLQLLHLTFTAEEPGQTWEATQAVARLAVDHTRFLANALLDGQPQWGIVHARYSSTLASIAAELRAPAIRQAAEEVQSIEDICRHRECDNFLENLTAVNLGLHQLMGSQGDLDGGMIAVGIIYGGIELPVIAEARAVDSNAPPTTMAQVRMSGYSDLGAGDLLRAATPGDVEDLRGHMSRLFSMGAVPYGLPVVLFDDGCTTGATIQAVRDVMVADGRDVVGAVTVRYPGANRTVHMRLPNHKLPDPDVLMSFIRGLVAPSPYTRLVVEGPTDETRYRDQTGWFDKSKERILRYLKKNGTPRVRSDDA